MMIVRPHILLHKYKAVDNLSPLNGNTVTTSGVVTGIKTNGFFLQMPVGDGNANTSDGIFVFTAGVPPLSVVVGNLLCVAEQ
jgi:predicted extracellular nuclease